MALSDADVQKQVRIDEKIAKVRSDWKSFVIRWIFMSA